MSSHNERQQSLILHTVTPESVPEGYTEGGYRTVVGLEVARKQLWLPGEHGDSEAEEFIVPAAMADTAAEYVEKHYVGEEAEHLYRNCHLGAAAITGAGFIKWHEALGLANDIVSRGATATDLAVGQWGAIGETGDIVARAHHSLVGIKPGLALQTDGENGPLSVVAHTANMAYHRANYGHDVEIFASTDENPRH